jgi:hypothetical protein
VPLGVRGSNDFYCFPLNDNDLTFVFNPTVEWFWSKKKNDGKKDPGGRK